MVSAGTFREDLYYRLNVIEIHVPPLRERAQDIPLLVDHFIKKSARENGKSVEWVTNETMSALVAAPWPGNVRELEHAIERAVILCRSTTLDLSLFPGLAVPEGEEARTATAAPSLPPVGRTLAEIERETILRTLEAVNGSTVRAAEILGISPRKIQYKIKEYRARGAVIRLVHDEDAQDQEAESGEPGPEVE
jgi:DNA-binding NtrC family response regulator